MATLYYHYINTVSQVPSISIIQSSTVLTDDPDINYNGADSGVELPGLVESVEIAVSRAPAAPRHHNALVRDRLQVVLVRVVRAEERAGAEPQVLQPPAPHHRP